jgi:hypothetical protein
MSSVRFTRPRSQNTGHLSEFAIRASSRPLLTVRGRAIVNGEVRASPCPHTLAARPTGLRRDARRVASERDTLTHYVLFAYDGKQTGPNARLLLEVPHSFFWRG